MFLVYINEREKIKYPISFGKDQDIYTFFFFFFFFLSSLSSKVSNIFLTFHRFPSRSDNFSRFPLSLSFSPRAIAFPRVPFFLSLSLSSPVPPSCMLPTDLFRIAYLLSRFACYSWYSNLLISTRIICFFAISYNFSTRFYDFFSFFLKKPIRFRPPSFIERSSTKFCNEITKYRRPS